MSWKKNAISYISWFLYVLITEAIVLICADELGRKAGLSVYMSALFAFAYAVLVGVIVLLIRKNLKIRRPVGKSGKVAGLILEAVLCVVLFAVGLWLRISDMDAMTQSAAYFETAQVAYGQSIPPVVHGAVYLYLQVLHGLFRLVGNHFVAGIWLQITLQMIAFLVLYFVVKRCAGAVAALITLSFGMCAPMMVTGALTLSPEILYLLLLVLAAAVFLTGYGRKIYPLLFLLFGGLAAVMTYLDIAGILLFVFAVMICFSSGEETCTAGRKMAAFACTVAGYAGVFAGTILLDASLTGKLFGNVLRAWVELYQWKPLTDIAISFSLEEIILTGMLVIGVFSFWCSKRRETITGSTCCILVFLLLSMCLTEEMNGGLYFVVMLVAMAGAFVGQVFCLKTEKRVFVEEELTSAEEAMEQVSLTNVHEVEKPETVVKQEAESPVIQTPQEVQETPKRPIQFIENPLPLPKKHEKRVLDYKLTLTEDADDFDVDVADDDDYDK